MLNSNRPSNPFTPSTEPAWIKKSLRPTPSVPAAAGNSDSGKIASPSQRINGAQTNPMSRVSTESAPAADTLSSSLRTSPRPTPEKVRKQPPSVPRKPAPLTSKAGPPSNDDRSPVPAGGSDPQRSGAQTPNLMDEMEDQEGQMKAWQPLRPR